MKIRVLIVTAFVSLLCVSIKIKALQVESGIKSLSDLALANVEALAVKEPYPGGSIECETIVTEFKEYYKNDDNLCVVFNQWDKHECYHGKGIECTQGAIYRIVEGKPCNNCINIVTLNCE